MKSLLLALVGLFPGVAAAQVIFQDDFSSGADDQWLRADFIGGTTYSAATGRYQMTTVELPAMDSFAFAGSAVIASALDPSFANGIFRTTVRMDNDATNVAMVARANVLATEGYGFLINNADPSQSFIGIGVLTNMVAVELVEVPIESGVDYIMEGALFGTELSLKVWEVGGVEPAEPQVRWSDSTYSMGIVGLGVLNQPASAGGSGGALSASFDDVSFAVPAPAVAPLMLVVGPVVWGRRGRGRGAEGQRGATRPLRRSR